MPRGVVRWFNDVAGWGFIRQDGIAEDIFVHYKGVKTKSEGRRTLVPEETVEYRIKMDVKGLRAMDLVRTSVEPSEGGPDGPYEPRAEIPAKVESATILKMRQDAAALGCGSCRGEVKSHPRSNPFLTGPWRGRYLCMECWTLYWAEHPEDLSDQDTKDLVLEESKKIRLKRENEILYEEGQNRVYLSPRGTLIFDIHTAVETGPNEFDPERFQSLIRAIRGISGKVPGYEVALTA